MGSSIKQGQSIFIPFVNGESFPDSQNRPRMYKTVEQFEKNSSVFHGEIPILIEYVPVDKKHVWETEVMNRPFCRDITKVCECVCATESNAVDQKNAEPPRLDRSAWEPCGFCSRQDRWVYKTQDYPGLCSFEVAQDGPDEIVVNAYNHNTPLTKDICFSFSVLFCPKCGRPLTDAAWKMLQKRLEGRK